MNTLFRPPLILALAALSATASLARADVGVSLSVGAPYAGVYVGGPPVYYAPQVYPVVPRYGVVPPAAYYGDAYYGSPYYYGAPPAYYPAPRYYAPPVIIYRGRYHGGG